MSRSFITRIRYLAIPVMVGLLGVYIVLHSPLRDAIAQRFGMVSRGCFLCIDWPSLPQAADALVASGFIIAAVCAALFTADRFSGASFERFLIFGLSAFAFIVIPAAFIGELAERLHGSFLHPPIGPMLASIPAIVVSVRALWRGWRPNRVIESLHISGGLLVILSTLGGLMLIASVGLGLLHPATSGDALSYHAPLAVYLWQDGNLGTFLDRAPDIWALAHPGMAEMFFGLLHIVGGEPLAILGQLPFTVLGMGAIYAFARRLGLLHKAALAGCLAYLLVPIVVMQSADQANDIVGAALVMTAIALASAPVSTWTGRRAAVLGLNLGLIATTKLALLPYVAAIALFCVGVLLVNNRLGMLNRSVLRRYFFILTIMFFITVAPWWTRNLVRYQNPIYPSAIPFLGRGVFVPNFGAIDISFVPSPIAWPLYPLIEPHDDRSGFGALFIIAAIPGFVFAVRRARHQPMVLFTLATVIMLPSWWIFTLHEPRFLLGIVGLSFAFIGWLLMALPHRWRTAAAGLLAAAAIFSVMVTFDQALLPLARQPTDRATFYDRVWGVDPIVTSLPEGEGILLNTGYAPTIFEYTAFYPLLGPTQSRLVIPVDGEIPTEKLVGIMQKAGIRYAYVAASPDSQSTVEAIFNPSVFELIHQSDIVPGEASGVRRVLYRAASDAEKAQATRRYLFRLK